MPFILYETNNDTYKRLREVELAGNNGPLATHMSRVCPNKGGWHLSEQELVKLLGGSVTSAVLIELKPNVQHNVSLYRLRDVWGYRDNEWSPLALRLESVYVDYEHNDPAAFKLQFGQPPMRGDIIHEFLYIQVNPRTKHWTWGLVGRVNGVLLWPEVLNYFIKEIQS